MTSNAKQGRLPLEGIRVVDFSRHLPGPWATTMLADFGATVVKVEQAGPGDASRHNPPEYAAGSVYFNNVNTGKRSLTLDLTRAEGREVVHRLLAQSDVVVESYRPGVPVKLGVDYATVSKLNPKIVYCSVSGFGQTGSLATVSGHDLVIQAMSGLMMKGLAPDEMPRNPGYQAADYTGGAMAVIAVLAALHRRNADGKGCYVDVSMYDSLMVMNPIVLTSALARRAGASGEPPIHAYGENPRYTTYRTRDGKAVAVCLLEAKLWAVFCRAIGREDLISEEETLAHRLTSHGDREAAYRSALAGYCAAHDRAAIVSQMCALSIPILPVLDADEALASDVVRERGIVDSVTTKEGAEALYLANPLRHAGLAAAKRTPAPGMGEHVDEILAELGYSEDQRNALKAKKVV